MELSLVLLQGCVKSIGVGSCWHREAASTGRGVHSTSTLSYHCALPQRTLPKRKAQPYFSMKQCQLCRRSRAHCFSEAVCNFVAVCNYCKLTSTVICPYFSAHASLLVLLWEGK